MVSSVVWDEVRRMLKQVLRGFGIQGFASITNQSSECLTFGKLWRSGCMVWVCLAFNADASLIQALVGSNKALTHWSSLAWSSLRSGDQATNAAMTLWKAAAEPKASRTDEATGRVEAEAGGAFQATDSTPGPREQRVEEFVGFCLNHLFVYTYIHICIHMYIDIYTHIGSKEIVYNQDQASRTVLQTWICVWILGPGILEQCNHA